MMEAVMGWRRRAVVRVEGRLRSRIVAGVEDVVWSELLAHSSERFQDEDLKSERDVVKTRMECGYRRLLVSYARTRRCRLQVVVHLNNLEILLNAQTASQIVNR
jgi:hypothetical protein